MSEYKGIKGFSIQSLSADPADPNIGQVWYNSTSGSWKVTSATTAGTWASGGNLNTARGRGAGGGTQTTGLYFGGDIPPVSAATEKYDGTSWASANNMNTKRQLLSGCGTQTAGLAFGGLEPTPFTTLAATEEYNGATWANSNNMVSVSRNAAGAGIQTAALAFGGTSDGANPLSPTLTQEYNGSSWTTSPGSLNTGRFSFGGLGTQTAALAFGGSIHQIQQQQKNIMELLGQQVLEV
jgi:hypothetical protein